MGRRKPNKPRRGRSRLRFDLSGVSHFGTAGDVEDVIKQAADSAIRHNGLTLATPAPGGLVYALKTFENLHQFASDIGLLDGYPVASILVISDVVHMEGQLSGLPSLDKGTLVSDLDNCRSAYAFQFSHTTKETN
ncbi:hypothetical protein ACH4MG_34950 [Streptomyces sp. NPDC017454]|uniref:hypothetical protein n=1 Tax=Streptomyces sp. NPDC017454 TaxID=3364997 RepID=UPI0037B26162